MEGLVGPREQQARNTAASCGSAMCFGKKRRRPNSC